MVAVEDVVFENGIYAFAEFIVCLACYVEDVVEEMCVGGEASSPVCEEDHFVIELICDEDYVVVDAGVFDAGA